MILLDTNVISELMREDPDAGVRHWIGIQKPVRIAVTTIAIAEIQRGLFRLPQGKRRSRLKQNFEGFLSEAFEGRIFDFDIQSAYTYGEISAKRELAGFNTDAVDLMIASIAKSRNAAIATRNTKDFEGCGIKIINPWKR